MKLNSLVLLSLFLVTAHSGSAEEREFTSLEGQKLVATIIDATAENVTILKASDQKEFVLPLDRLSEEDRSYVTTWLTAKQANTRSAKKLKIQVGDGIVQEVAVPEGEYLNAQGVLTLHPGDRVHLEFDENTHKPKVVEKVNNPERTVTFSMSQKESITMVNRTTKMQKTVAMDCENRSFGEETFQRTNLNPTEKGLASFDMWPVSVWTVKLSNFEVTDRPASEVYRERVSK